MEMAEKVNKVAAIVQASETESALLCAYLTAARSAILNRMYPFGIPDNVDDVPKRYESLQIDIAVVLYSKQGAEGERNRVENGITRTFENAYIPEAMLGCITPMGVVY